MSIPYIDIHTHNPRPEIWSPTMAGIHPWHSDKGLSLPNLGECDIIGETGLDFASNVSRDAQMQMFRAHLREAERLNKPVVLHVVRSFEEVMRELTRHSLSGVLFHGFIGSVEQAKRCYKAGYYLSFGRRSLSSPRTREVIAGAPDNLLFCETDDDLTMPIEQVYERIASLRDTSIEELAAQIYSNYKNFLQHNG